MSKKQPVQTQNQEKVITKYDLKVQKRKEAEIKEQKEKKRAKLISIVVVIALLCFIASFPIRSYMAINQAYIVVDGEKVTKVEFDYNYNVSKNSYLNTYGSYLPMFGISDVTTIESQAYTDKLTYKDYFEQLAVESIKTTKAMLNEIEASGFSYDVTEDYQNVIDSLTNFAKEEGVTLDTYVSNIYGSLATMSRIESVIKESLLASAYYNKISEEKTPEDESIVAYYNDNKDSYDWIDYKMSIVNAELPTTSPDGTVETDEEGKEVAYQPTEEEIQTAMNIARTEAETLLTTIDTNGEEYIGQSRSNVTSLLRDYLFAEERKVGDSTIIEDSTNNRYYVISFDNRYLNQKPSVNMRAIITASMDGTTILDEWSKGEATEESFIELCKKYDENGMASTGGLYEGVTSSSLEDEMANWLFADDRVEGDTTAITTAEGSNYVLYYLGENDPEWKLSIRSTLLSTVMNEYVEEISANIEVIDEKRNLNYLQVAALEEALANMEATENEEIATEETVEETTEETTEE